jgi:protein O-GlcNAc transferase
VASIQQLLQDGLAAFNAGRAADAEKAFRAVLAREPRNTDALNLRGLSLLRLGRAADGAASIAAAIAVRGGEPSFRLNHGVALKAAGRSAEALAAFREAIRLAPAYAQAHLNIGNTLREQGDLAGAAAAYLRALELVPNAPTVLNNLGNVRREQGDFHEAIETYRRAVAAQPDYVEALTNLGSVALAGGQVEVSVEALERAAILDPRSELIATMLGRALIYAGRLEEAEASYRRAIVLAPRSLEARGDLAELYAGLGLVRQALEVFDDIASIDGARPERLSSLLFVSNYDGSLEATEITRRARAFGQALDRSKRIALPTIQRDSAQPLRVGLVSGDFRHHVVMEFVRGLLPSFDPARIQLFAYSATPVRDEVTKELQRRIPNWLDIEKLPDAVVAERIAGDRIDVLVDMTGHTRNSRLAIFGLKPAPVQATWLGYSGTTGVDEIDFIIGDAVVTPPDEEAQLIETPWRMPHSYLCYTAPGYDVAVGPLPSTSTGHVTFGSFNNLGKLSDRTMSLWGRVLDAVPGGRLLIKSPQLKRLAGRG